MGRKVLHLVPQIGTTLASLLDVFAPFYSSGDAGNTHEHLAGSPDEAHNPAGGLNE